MTVVITYLYGSISANIFMNILEGFKISEAYKLTDRNLRSIKLQHLLYRLKKIDARVQLFK